MIDIIAYSCLATYALLFSFFWVGWRLIPLLSSDTTTKISVIIPFRNEAENIPNLVASLNQIIYDCNAVEFIFINDHSNDKGEEILKEKLINTSLRYKIISLPKEKQGKKQAILLGVEQAKFDYIVTTDADCTHPQKWLMEFNNAFAKNNSFVIAPVANAKPNSFLAHLLEIESYMLAGVTIGSAGHQIPFLCSGANLGYKKALFKTLHPYQENLHIASGDDLFFLDKIIDYNTPVFVLKSKQALVLTSPPKSYKQLIQQALRWNGKNKNLKAKRNFYLSILVFIVNIFVLFYFFQTPSKVSFLFLSSKFLFDFLFLSHVTHHLGGWKKLFYTPIVFVLYPLHLVLLFFASFVILPKWKNRDLS